MEKKTLKLGLMEIVMVGLFSALSYVALSVFKIPIPSPVGTPFLHFGNMFVILAALLFSGVIGGLSGSIGMGLWDVSHGYVHYVHKTIILKFGIGFFTGLIACKGHKKDAKSPRLYILALSIIFIVFGIAFALLIFSKGEVIKIEPLSNEIFISSLVYIFCFIIGVLLLATFFIIQHISIRLQYAILGGVAGIIFNLVGEFLFKVIDLMITGSQLQPAILASILNLPATLMNGIFSVIVAILLYIPLYKALTHAGLLKPDTYTS